MLWRGGQRLALIFSVVYIGIVLSHPFAPHRYLVALLPVFYLSVLAGARAVAELVDRALLRWRTFHAARAAVLATAVFLLVGNLAWIQYILTPSPSGTVRGWYGVDFGYRWDGFEETFRLESATTPPPTIGWEVSSTRCTTCILAGRRSDPGFTGPRPIFTRTVAPTRSSDAPPTSRASSAH